MMLSKVSKEVLIKAVLHVISTYCMICFLRPATLTMELDRLFNSFWWGTKTTRGKGVVWVRWECLCKKKDHGGIGFKDLRGFNLSMIDKQG
ncbi:Uncharacterized mitochondrial protein AtMg00310 [Linum grandiflorum]